MRERILMTGAAGFIGAHLARTLLDAGAVVGGVDNFDPFYDRSVKERNLARLLEAGPAFRFAEADVRDRAALTRFAHDLRPTAVVHLAGLAGVRPSVADPERYVDVNVGGLATVLEVARRIGCSNLVFASSSSVYGDGPDAPRAEDDDADDPVSPYAATKRAGELLCAAHARLHGLRVAAVRLFTVYGPGQRPDLAVARFMDGLARGEAVEMYGDGSTRRDYTFVGDVVAGIRTVIRMLSSAPPGCARAYNLGAGEPVRLGALIAAIGAVVGVEPRIVRRPPQPGDVRCTWADIRRARRELGWAPVTTLAAGLQAQWLSHRASAPPSRSPGSRSTRLPSPDTTVSSPAQSASLAAASAAG